MLFAAPAQVSSWHIAAEGERAGCPQLVEADIRAWTATSGVVTAETL
jgi:hypothetical protein